MTRSSSDYGYLNSQTNRRIFLDDPEAPLVQALEVDYDQGVSRTSKAAKDEGVEPRAASARKADILSRRVLFPPQDNIVVSTAKDALLASLNIKGRVDMAYMMGSTTRAKTPSSTS
jgi:N12 class adenine-specific DNA methylase